MHGAWRLSVGVSFVLGVYCGVSRVFQGALNHYSTMGDDPTIKVAACLVLKKEWSSVSPD